MGLTDDMALLYKSLVTHSWNLFQTGLVFVFIFLHFIILCFSKKNQICPQKNVEVKVKVKKIKFVKTDEISFWNKYYTYPWNDPEICFH